MPQVIARGQSVGPDDPRIVFFHTPDGTLIDPFALSFQIFDVSTEAKQLAPSQVYPSTPGDRIEIDVSAGSPDRMKIRPSDKFDPSMGGCFAASWTPGAGEPFGRHMVRWFWTQKEGADERSCDQFFDVYSCRMPPGGVIYALPSEVRDEGLPSSGIGAVTDARLLLASIKAAQFIERITRRFFEPRFLSIAVDGKNSGAIMIGPGTPIIGIDVIRYATTHLLLSSLAADSNSYRVYSRHLSQGLLSPDDRDNPRLELYGLKDYLTIYSLADLRFPRGQQNVEVSGVFGYTEADGSPMGCTPVLLREAAMRLTLRNTGKLTDSDAETDRRFAARITSERTRDQAITYSAGMPPGSLSAGAAAGAFSGDPLIDSLLGGFLCPPDMGAC